MANSSFPNFSAELLALLNAASWPTSTPQIADGADVVIDTQREFVLLGNAEGDEDWFALGKQRKNERMKQYVVIRVNVVNDVQVAATSRAFELFGVVETVMRTDPTVGNTVTSAQVKGWKLRKQGNAQGRWAELTVTLQVDYALI